MLLTKPGMLLSRLWSVLRREPECCRRKRSGLTEMFCYLGYHFIFNVDRANEIVRDGRQPVEIEEDSVQMTVRTNELEPEHVAHVDPDRPGIIAHVQYTTEQGETFTGQVLIDGNHRAARCVELKRPFFAYLLSEEESRAILLRQPGPGDFVAVESAQPAEPSAV